MPNLSEVTRRPALRTLSARHVAAVGGLLGGEAVDAVLLVRVLGVGVAVLAGRLLHCSVLDEPRKQCYSVYNYHAVPRNPMLPNDLEKRGVLQGAREQQ